MDASTDAVRRERLDEVLALAHQRLAADRVSVFDAFARECFGQLDAEEVAERRAEDMAGWLLSHWQFGAQRTPGTPKVRVLSPSIAEDGWSSHHSVVEIVNDDMPFLVDSTAVEINRQGLTTHLLVHPVYSVERDAGGALTSIGPAAAGKKRESWMHIEIDRMVDAEQRHALVAGIEKVLADVRAAVSDWKAMVQRLQDAIAEYTRLAARPPAGLDAAEAAECRAFLEWLGQDHLVLLGYRQHDLVRHEGVDALRLVPGTGLGVLRELAGEPAKPGSAGLPPAARALARAQRPMLVVTKANTRSTIHRPGYTDYIGVKRYNDHGEVIGEHRFLGLFTSTAYSARVAETPLLRRKVEAIAARAGLPPGGHRSKALAHILETYPRDDLFQIGEDELYEAAFGILTLGDRQRLRLFLRRDPFDRFVSCLLYVPRESFSTDLRLKCQALLAAAFNGRSDDFDVLLGEGALARIHVVVRTTPGEVPPYDRRELELKLGQVARRWSDQLRDALVEAEGEARGLAHFKAWHQAFPADYRERVNARAAVADVRKLAQLTEAQSLALSLYKPLGAEPGVWGFKVYRRGGAVVLSDSLPMLERMGVRVMGEHNHRIVGAAAAGGPLADSFVSLHDFDIRAPIAEDAEPQEVARLFEDCFARVFEGQIENDDFNRLVLRAGLPADEVVILRAYARYCKQIGFALSQATIEATLAAQPSIAHMLVHLFKLRLSPTERDDEAAASQVNAIHRALEKVSNLSEDRVLRQLLGLMLATLRTNYWRTGRGHSGEAGPRRSFVSFKFDCAKVPGLPEPKPLFEIFVYSPRFEGVHLRGGKVARGGLRWSDRPEDFRTEVLGLVKAQMVKNTVIVPVGSKGGFVLKKAPPAGPSQADREAFMKEGVACYQDYLRGLLDLTDNLVGGKVVPPPMIVRHDADDPYLVVAADKGTATFSDYANAVSAEYGHWLGDAFASGGSVGYDHKAMGITARGAWESVKRLFRERGVDIQSTPFTVAGIGDMSGDVFGNGMLLSRQTKLVAAFDHRHVFLDPDPDPASSFAERERLFKLPRSSWADYDTQLISAGGGVWSRNEKSVPLSPQVRQVLGLEAEKLTPTELITAILKAPVDLLYNGGIGTYVKASTESHADVGDRANEAVRINGRELRCKVVGEGGNLGFTQRGRIEAALFGAGGAGVSLNTDAIDNSAGVDTSDHEVNIKILLGLAIADGEMTTKQRNTLLAQMTDEVATLVLRDNYFQTQVLSITHRLGKRLLDQEGRFIRFLEKQGRLNRAIEFLPGDDEIAERKAAGGRLTTPERAVLLAYCKMWLFDEILASDLPEDEWVGTALARYFPGTLREKMAAYIPRHPLKREIVATYVLNSMVNRVGATFTHRIAEMTGAKPAQVVRAYLLAREVFGVVGLWQQIETLDNQVPDALQAEMLIHEGWLTSRATTWFLRSRRLTEPMAPTIGRLLPAVASLAARLAPAASKSALAVGWIAAGVPSELATRIASAEGLLDALDVAEVAEATRRPFDEVCEVHVGIGERLGLARLRTQIDALPSDSYWQSRAKTALGDDLSGLQRALAQEVLAGHEGAAAEMIGQWETAHAVSLERARRLLADLSETKQADLAMLSVALRELRNLV